MADKFMYIPHDDTQYYSTSIFKLLSEKFEYINFNPTYPDSIKVPKVFKQTSNGRDLNG